MASPSRLTHCPTARVGGVCSRSPALQELPLYEIVLGKRGITADTALRLSRFLKTSPQMWMHLQADWDLQQAVRRAARQAS